MTASATASPITLLGSVADTAKAAAPAAATISTDAAGDGFQLLLAQAADAVRSAAGLLALPTDTVAAVSSDPEQPASADGNALPPLGGLLPLAPVAATAESDTGAGGENKSSASDNDDDDATVMPVGLMIGLPAASITPPEVEVASMSVTESVAMAAPIAAGTAMPLRDPGSMAEPAKLPPAPVAAASVSASASDQTAIAQFAVTLPSAGEAAADTTAPDTNKTENPAPLSALKIATEVRGDASASAAQSVVARAPIGAEKPAGAEASGESDFDALIKQLDAASLTGSTSTSSTAAGVDGSRVVHQAARAYAAPPVATATVSVPVNAEGWSDAVTDKVMWFSAQNIKSAEIHLNPPDLGPLQVRISTQQDQTSVVFSSQHAAVRDALDQALPRLRDMLGGQGLQLADVGVGQGSTRQHDNTPQNNGQQAQGRAATNGFFGDGSDSAEPIAVTAIVASRLPRSGIDAYA